MGKRARRRVVLAAGAAVALLAGACGPTPPTPDADFQMHARDSVFGYVLSCAATPGSFLYPLTGVGTSVGFTSETVDGVTEAVATFSQGAGFDISGVIGDVEADTYSIVLLVRMSQLGGFDRLLDFKNRAADSGLYLYNGSLRFYPSSATGSKVVANNEWAQVVITRATDGTVRGVVDGVQQWQFADSGGLGVISSNRLVFFADNVSGGGTGEQSAGAVARVRLFKRALSSTEVSRLGQTPSTPCAV
jgi:hypothetical protein